MLWTANVDGIPDLTTTPHEICDEVGSDEEVAKMWDGLKLHCRELERQLAEFKAQRDAYKMAYDSNREECAYWFGQALEYRATVERVTGLPAPWPMGARGECAS